MGLLDFFARRKALSASPGVLESIRDRSWSPYPSLGGTNNQRVSAAWERGINGSYEWIYATQPAVRSVIDFIARNTSQLPLKCFERVGDTERRRDEDHPAAQTMAHPDEGTPADAFIYRLVTDYLIWDNAYFLKFRDPGTSRFVLARMPPNCVTVQGGRFTPDSYWFWREDGSWLGPIPPQDIFHWYGYNPSDPLLGLSKLETLRQELATDSAIQSSLVELAKSGLKGGYISRPLEAPEWDQEDAKRFIEQWRAMKMRSDGGDPILEEGMEFKQTGISPRDAELLASRRFTKEEVASLYGVPLEAFSSTSLSNSPESRRLVYADVLPPITNALAAQLDVDILQAEYGEMSYYFEFDLNAKLQGDLENRYPMMTAAAGRPWLTVNEVRALENKPPVDGGDDLTIPLNVAIGDNPKPAPNVMGPQDPNKPLQDGSYREPKALTKAGFDPDQLRDPNTGEWVDVPGIKAAIDAIEGSFSDLTLDVSVRPEGIVLSRIKVSEESRGLGVAAQAMKKLTAVADEHNVPIALTPDPVGEGGLSKTALTKWYRKLGFVPNKGRNKDYAFTESMIRPPQGGKSLTNGHKALEVSTQPRRLADMARQKRNVDEAQAMFYGWYSRQGRVLQSKKSNTADTDDWNAELAAKIEAFVKTVVEREGGFYVARLAGDDFDMRLVENYLKAMSEGAAEGINKVTAQDIAELGVVAALSRARNERAPVAGTSIGVRATVFAREEAAKQAPNPERRFKTWIKDTERHDKYHGVSVPLGADWGGIEPGSEPNCACSVSIA